MAIIHSFMSTLSNKVLIINDATLAFRWVKHLKLTRVVNLPAIIELQRKFLLDDARRGFNLQRSY